VLISIETQPPIPDLMLRYLHMGGHKLLDTRSNIESCGANAYQVSGIIS